MVPTVLDRQQHFYHNGRRVTKERSREAILQSMAACDSGIMKFLYRWGLSWWINTSRGISARRSRWVVRQRRGYGRLRGSGVRTREIALKGRMPWDATSGNSRILVDNPLAESPSGKRAAECASNPSLCPLHFLFHAFETYFLDLIKRISGYIEI